MMMRHGGDWMWGGSILMTVAMVVFFALIIVAIVLAVRYLASSPGTGSAPTPGPSAAESLLAERYARGEIDDDEYQRRITLLHQHR
ncbi:SHOCT domain-containing protein [Mycobacterium heidelbergense]|uniref:SHOCT domain-containing protein n=1 Tax=Mycobacterium heidelbergense TaxID=53376 RepID=UPI003CEF2A55